MRLLKPVDNKFKVHLIINYSSEENKQNILDRYHLVRSHHGG